MIRITREDAPRTSMRLERVGLEPVGLEPVGLNLACGPLAPEGVAASGTGFLPVVGSLAAFSNARARRLESS